MWFVDILRTVLIRLDLLVYTFIRIFYNLFYAISRVGINAGMADKVINNFKAVVGVYAIFKVVFVLITMMINPDEAAKSNNNIGKVAVRVVVVIALIMLVEPIFNKAFELQNAIISENLIGQIILSDEADSVVDASGYNDAGQDMANKIFAGFVNMHEDAVNEGVSLDPSDEDFNSATVLNDVSKNSCAGAFQKWLEMYNAVDTGDAKTRGISTIMGSINDKFENSDGDEKYCIQYNAGLSTVAGGLAAYMLIVYCLDIGLRIVKLVFYQLIAPIPIASYVDGKKDGPFQRWYKSCLTEYADIFIRLIIIYTVVYLIKNIGIIFDFSSLSGTGLTGLFARAIIILGMLMFAKQAPSLITQMLTGKEPTGRFGLNAKEKINKSPFATAAIGAVGGGAAALASNAIAGGMQVKDAVVKSRGQNTLERGKQIAKSIAGATGSTVAGAGSGLVRGGKSGINSKDFNLKNSISSTLQSTNKARNDRDKRASDLNDRLAEEGMSASAWNRAKMRAGDIPGNVRYSVGQRFAQINPKEDKTRAGAISRWQDEASNFTSAIQNILKENPDVISTYNDKPLDTGLFSYTDTTGSDVLLKGYYNSHVDNSLVAKENSGTITAEELSTLTQQRRITELEMKKAFADAKAKHESSIKEGQTKKSDKK